MAHFAINAELVQRLIAIVEILLLFCRLGCLFSGKTLILCFFFWVGKTLTLILSFSQRILFLVWTSTMSSFGWVSDQLCGCQTSPAKIELIDFYHYACSLLPYLPIPLLLVRLLVRWKCINVVTSFNIYCEAIIKEGEGNTKYSLNFIICG